MKEITSRGSTARYFQREYGKSPENAEFHYNMKNTSEMVPCANPRVQFLSQEAEIRKAINRVLDRGQYILGPEVAAFENEFSGFTGRKYGVGTGSGTEALHLALVTCGIGPGDEVITVSHSAVATATAIILSGAKPVFIDIEPDTFTINADLIEKAISPNTRAIIPVHLYGHPANMPHILKVAQKHGLKVIEDCAQAPGASIGESRVGSLGDISAFSFYPTKNIGAIGDAGMVVTQDETLASKARSLREYGWNTRGVSSLPGWNTRLDEMQAAILRVKLPKLDQANERRREIAEKYRSNLEQDDLVLPEVRFDAAHVFHLYVIRTGHRDALRKALSNAGVQTGIHYPTPIHQQPVFVNERQGSPLTITEEVAEKILSLPMYPELAGNQIERVISALLEFLVRGRT